MFSEPPALPNNLLSKEIGALRKRLFRKVAFDVRLAMGHCSLGDIVLKIKCHTVFFGFCFGFFKRNIFRKIFFLIYLFMVVLGLRFCARAFSSCGKRGPLFIAVRGPLTIAASRCGAQAPDAQAQ